MRTSSGLLEKRPQYPLPESIIIPPSDPHVSFVPQQPLTLPTLPSVAFPSPSAARAETMFRRMPLGTPLAFPLVLEKDTPIPQAILDLSATDSQTKIDTFTPFNTLVAYSRSQVIFWNYRSQAKSTLNRDVRLVIFCHVSAEAAMFLVQGFTGLATLYCLKPDMAFYDTQESVLLPQVEYFTFEPKLNAAVFVGRTGPPSILSVDSLNQRVTLVPALRQPDSLSKKIKRIGSCFRQKPTHFAHKITQKGQLLVHLKTSFFGARAPLQTVTVYEVGLRSVRETRRLKLDHFLDKNMSVFHVEKELRDLQTAGLVIADARAGPFPGQLTLLFRQGLLMTLDLETEYVKRVIHFGVRDFGESNFAFLDLLSPSKVLFQRGKQLELVHLTVDPVLHFPQASPTQATTISLPDDFDPRTSVVVYDPHHSPTELFQRSRTIFTFERSRIRTFSLLSTSELIENLLIFETENPRTTPRDFTRHLIQVAHDTGIRRFCRILLALIFKQRPSANQEYQRQIAERFQGAPRADQTPVSQDKGRPVPAKAFHDVVLKYLVIFERLNPAVFDLVFEGRKLSEFVVLKLEPETGRRLFETPPGHRSYRPGYFLELLHKHFRDVFALPVLEASSIPPTVDTYLTGQVSLKTPAVKLVNSVLEGWEVVLGTEPGFLLQVNSMKVDIFDALGVSNFLDQVFFTEEDVRPEPSIRTQALDALRIFEFVSFLNDASEALPERLLGLLVGVNIGHLLDNPSHKQLIRRLIAAIYFRSEKLDASFLEKFFTQSDIQELELIRDSLAGVPREPELLSIAFPVLLDTYDAFAAKDLRSQFLKLVLARLNRLFSTASKSAGPSSASEPRAAQPTADSAATAEADDIVNFMACSMFILLTEQRPAGLEVRKLLRKAWRSFKAFWVSQDPSETSVSFELDLKSIPIPEKQTLVATILPAVMRSRCPKVREVALHLLLEFNRRPLTPELQTSINPLDLISLLETADTERFHLISRDNIDFVLFYLFDHGLHRAAIQVVLKVLSRPNVLQDAFLRLTFDEFVLRQSDQTKTSIREIEEAVATLPLHTPLTISNWLSMAHQALLALPEDDWETRQRCAAELSLFTETHKSVEILLSFLAEKRVHLESLRHHSHISPNETLLTRIFQYFDFVGGYLQANLRLPQEAAFRHVVREFRLPVVDFSTKAAEKPVFLQVVGIISQKGAVATLPAAQKIHSHFASKAELSDGFDDALVLLGDQHQAAGVFEPHTPLFELLPDPPIDFLDSFPLVYPHNLTPNFRRSLALFLSTAPCQETSEVIRLVESFNNISEITRLNDPYLPHNFAERPPNNLWFIDLLTNDRHPAHIVKTLSQYCDLYHAADIPSDSRTAASLKRSYASQIVALLKRLLDPVCNLLISGISDNYLLRFFTDNLEVVRDALRLADRAHSELKSTNATYYILKNGKVLSQLKTTFDRLLRDPRIQSLRQRPN